MGFFSKKNKKEHDSETSESKQLQGKIIRAVTLEGYGVTFVYILYNSQEFYENPEQIKYATFAVSRVDNVGVAKACMLKEGDEVTLYYSVNGVWIYPQLFGALIHTPPFNDEPPNIDRRKNPNQRVEPSPTPPVVGPLSFRAPS